VGRTAIVVAHRLSTVRMLDRILVFDHGRIVEEGSHETLVRKLGGVYQRLFEKQALGLVSDLV
jgi:ATP-binding cassette, subfamily B, bacterial